MSKKILGILLCFCAFGYGLLVWKYEVFPYKKLATFKTYFAGSIEHELAEKSFPKEVISSHVHFERTVYNFLNSSKLSGWGGGKIDY